MRLFRTQKYQGKRFGGYILGKCIGEGRYGVCFLAMSDEDKPVIIKKFKQGMFKRNTEKNAYEAVILSQLKDQRIPELLGVINEKGFYGFVLDFKEGDTLKSLLFEQRHQFSDSEFFSIGIQLIRIIKYLHGKGVVHKDIRIPNVLIRDGEVRLIDFGLARWADADQYPYNLDYSYLGDILLYLLYSSFEAPKNQKKTAWYGELPLTDRQKTFIKRLLGLEPAHESIDAVERDFLKVFGEADSRT